jgi:hypothetical protein
VRVEEAGAHAGLGRDSLERDRFPSSVELGDRAAGTFFGGE